MERRKGHKADKKARAGGGATDKKQSAAKAKRAPKPRETDIAKTALGAAPEKRGLKKTPGKKAVARKVDETGHRELTQQVKRGRYLKHSSTLWLHRQLNDPYVARAKAEGYRSRAAYKLIELNEKFALLKKGARIVDLGCAPGGWLQVAVKEGAAHVVGIDYLGCDAIAGAEILELDFLEEGADAALKDALGGPADIVLSDMAAPTTGHRATDHLRIIALAEAALDFAEDVLAPGGVFVCKVFQGGAEGDLLKRLKANFPVVRHAKPKASRADSAEMYVVATGFRGRA